MLLPLGFHHLRLALPGKAIDFTSPAFGSHVFCCKKLQKQLCLSLSVIRTPGLLTSTPGVGHSLLCPDTPVSTTEMFASSCLAHLVLCCSQEHSGRVFRLQFDEFQIISSSHDDTILIWDFLNVPPSAQNETRSPSRTYTYISR